MNQIIVDETELVVQMTHHHKNNHVNHVLTPSDHVHQIDKIEIDNVDTIKGYIANMM